MSDTAGAMATRARRGAGGTFGWRGFIGEPCRPDIYLLPLGNCSIGFALPANAAA